MQAKTLVKPVNTNKSTNKVKAIPKVVNLNLKQVQRRMSPQPYLCTYCRKEGHLRDFCYLLKDKYYAGKPNLSQLTGFEEQMAYLVAKSQFLVKNLEKISKPQRKQKRTIKKNDNARVSLKHSSKLKQIWIRKDELRHYDMKADDPTSITSHKSTTIIEPLVDHSLGECLAF